MRVGFLRLGIVVLAALSASFLPEKSQTQQTPPMTSTATSKPAAPGSETEAISTNISQFAWTPMVPQMGKDSPVISIVHENPKTHSRQFFIRMPPNFHVPAHFHSANETHTVLEGTFIIEANGKRVALTAGGFNHTPSGVVHEAWTPPDQGALIFVTVDGPYDLLQK